MYLCLSELFEIKLFLCIKMGLAFDNLQYAIKPNETKPSAEK